jgi:hypothetical protein
MKPGKKRTMKTARDLQHHLSIISPRQALRMKEGRVESLPTDYKRMNSLEDARRAKSRKVIDELEEQRRFEREHTDYA